ncbi:MAG: iron-sulfur cluster assembly scaffold protein [Nanoarchaeota archaeon]|nr:iron-sulfur cluster assembly scaffold protein [Nanoarchaeota archaeon]
MSFNYSKKVMENFLNPKNFGKIKNPDARGKAGSPACGDIMEMSLLVDKKTKKIKEIKFQTFGCAAAIATTSILTQMIKGKTISQAKKITMKDIAKKLKGLPQIKMHCSTLSILTLKKTIENYENKKEKN